MTHDPGPHSASLRIFIVAGEHSGDALGGKLTAALKVATAHPIVFGGVGGDHMQAEGFNSLFPMSDVAVMGPIAILKKLRPIVRRVYQTVDAAIAFAPDVVVIVDSPEFTHPIAKRIRKRRPDIPIVDYVSPTVWAWRPGRAPAMRKYVDHLLALLPFEPAVHVRLGGPACSYVGHPLIERHGWLDALDTAPLRAQIGLQEAAVPLVVLPGSRRSEITRLLDTFRATVELVARARPGIEVLMPVVPNLAGEIRQAVTSWSVPVHILEGDEAKWRAFKLSRAALAASGTVTLELALAGTPMVVGYRVERLAAMVLKRMAKAPSAVLPNLILGENAFPEFLQEACTAEKLAGALELLLAEGPELNRQRSALQRLPALLKLDHGTPSQAAADIVVHYAKHGRHITH